MISPSRPAGIVIAIAFAVLLVVTTALSWPALTGPFLFDDIPNLEHLSVLDGKTDWRSLAHYASLFEGQPGRPLSMLSFVINDASWPSDPWSFKYTNLLLHLLVGTLLFGLSRALAQLNADNAKADLVALIAVAAWLLHPMQLSTSMLVVQRMTQLSALFAVAGLWGYVAIARRAQSSLDAFWAISVLGLGTVLSVLCKENGALTPMLALVLNGTLLRRKLEQLPTSARAMLMGGATLPVLGMLAAIILRWDSLTWYGTRDFTMTERLLSEMRALCDYLYRILIPNLRGGGIYHDDFTTSKGMLSPWTTLPSLVFVVGALCVAFVTRHRWTVFAFGALWYFAGHLLESTVFPLELYFEHRNYLPMFGPLFALGVVVARPHSRARISLALAALWIAYAAFLTSVQARVWGSSSALATVWAIEHPRSARAIQQQADSLSRAGRAKQAASLLLDAYEEGVRGSAFPLQALTLACRSHDAKVAQDAQTLLYGLELDPYEPAVLSTVRGLRLTVQSNTCPKLVNQAGWLNVTEAILSNPHFAVGEAQAYLHVERGYMFRHRRNLNATMTEFEAAWRVNPDPALARLMAATLASAGLIGDAKVWARNSLLHQPKGLRGILSQDEKKATRLLEALRKIEAADTSMTARPDKHEASSPPNDRSP